MRLQSLSESVLSSLLRDVVHENFHGYTILRLWPRKLEDDLVNVQKM
jgi:hypothetical protein